MYTQLKKNKQIFHVFFSHDSLFQIQTKITTLFSMDGFLDRQIEENTDKRFMFCLYPVYFKFIFLHNFKYIFLICKKKIFFYFLLFILQFG